MRARKWRGTVWAARLGLFALALNLLVPIHIAFDLAEALEATQEQGTDSDVSGAERHVLALLVGHFDDGHESHEHGKPHGDGCPVCSALGALAGFAAPVPTIPSVPPLAGLPAALPVTQGELVRAPTAYRSRAPPLA